MNVGELYAQSLSDSLTLYWRKPESAPANAAIEILLNGTPVGQSNQTHFIVDGLHPQQEYRAEVRLDGKSIGECSVCTRPELHRLDVRTFGAAGGGKTMDTAALQRTIDACGPLEEVYLPAGVYLSGALRLHSDMALHLDKDPWQKLRPRRSP